MKTTRGWKKFLSAVRERKISKEMAGRTFQVIVIRRSSVRITVHVSTHKGYEARRVVLAAMKEWASVHVTELGANDCAGGEDVNDLQLEGSQESETS